MRAGLLGRVAGDRSRSHTGLLPGRRTARHQRSYSRLFSSGNAQQGARHYALVGRRALQHVQRRWILASSNPLQGQSAGCAARLGRSRERCNHHVNERMRVVAVEGAAAGSATRTGSPRRSRLMPSRSSAVPLDVRRKVQPRQARVLTGSQTPTPCCAARQRNAARRDGGRPRVHLRAGGGDNRRSCASGRRASAARLDERLRAPPARRRPSTCIVGAVPHQANEGPSWACARSPEASEPARSAPGPCLSRDPGARGACV